MSAPALAELLQHLDALPRLPDTMVRLIRVVRDPASTMQQIVEAIRYDQAVTTQLLRLCNSAYFGLPRPIASVDDAVRYVGTAQLLRLVLAAHTRALLGPEQAGYGLPPGALWFHSVGVALGCQVLADELALPDKGVAFTVGLLHDIGKIVLNEYVSAEYVQIVRLVGQARLSFIEAEERVLGVTHAEIGERLARRWHLPHPIPCCIRYHHEPCALPAAAPLVDAVHLADAACLLMGIGGGDDSPLYRVDEGVLERTGLKTDDIERVGATIVVELKAVQRLFGIE